MAVYSVVIPVLYPGSSVCRARSNAGNAHAAEDNLLHLDDHSIFEESKDCMKRKILIPVISLILLVFLAGLTSALLYTGVIHVNNPSRSKYPVRGVDVSHHQGEIDWDKLSKEDISFAFIK